jgi:hypothetical protein
VLNPRGEPSVERRGRDRDAFAGCSIQTQDKSNGTRHARITYECIRPEDLLSEVREVNLCNTNLPLAIIRHAFTTNGPRDDLVAKTDTNDFDIWFVRNDGHCVFYKLVYPVDIFVRASR